MPKLSQFKVLVLSNLNYCWFLRNQINVAPQDSGWDSNRNIFEEHKKLKVASTNVFAFCRLCECRTAMFSPLVWCHTTHGGGTTGLDAAAPTFPLPSGRSNKTWSWPQSRAAGWNITTLKCCTVSFSSSYLWVLFKLVHVRFH